MAAFGATFFNFFVFSISRHVESKTFQAWFTMEKILLFIIPTTVMLAAPLVPKSIMPFFFVFEAFGSLIPSINVSLCLVKAAYRGWFHINDEYFRGTSIYGINGCLIEMCVSGLYILLLPLLTLYYETAATRRENDGNLQKIESDTNLKA
jgi:hypothetical protein